MLPQYGVFKQAAYVVLGFLLIFFGGEREVDWFGFFFPFET